MNAPTSAARSCSPSRPAGALALSAAALLALGHAAAPAPASPRAAHGDEAPAGVAPVMARLAKDLRALEAALEGEEREASLASVRSLGEGVDLVLELAPAISPDPALAELLAGCERTLGETSGLVDAGRFDGARQSLEELRAACVTCHVRYRDDNALRGMFPARRNTVSGTVTLSDAEGATLANRAWTLVFLESVAADRAWPNRRDNPSISQQNRQFHPRVLPVVVGTSVDFPNDDYIFHNVFSLSKARTFDLGTYVAGESRTVEMNTTGLIKVYCNIHPEMQASVVVLGNPWFALTDGGGSFVITGVEDGEYTLRVWNERGAEARRPLVVADGEWLTVDLESRETVRVLTHRNKYGKPYPEKY